ncbi:unnamed protein product [Boreogadus saida]
MRKSRARRSHVLRLVCSAECCARDLLFLRVSVVGSRWCILRLSLRRSPPPHRGSMETCGGRIIFRER